MGCGGNCDCACARDKKENETCAAPEEGAALDQEGRCPCGKAKDDCCHADLIAVNALEKTAR